MSKNVCKFVIDSKVQKYKIFSILEKISTTNSQKNIKEGSAEVADTAMSAQQTVARLMPFSPDATRFSIVCRRNDYSAGRIARAIEDCNANVLNLNVTSDTADDADHIVVDVRVDRKNIDSISRSLARYDYYVEGITDYTDYVIAERDRMRVAELLRHLDI